MVSRRTFLLGTVGTAILGAAGAFAAVEENVIPGRHLLARVTGACDVDATPQAGPTGNLTSGRFVSAARQREVGWSLATPPGAIPADHLPVVLVLHGRGVDHTTAFTRLLLHEFLAQHVRGGGTPFALAAVDGGDAYWHPRANGDNPMRMLTTEFLPVLQKLGLRTDRIGVLGWSMGGYGALLLGRESHRGSLPGGVTVVAAAAGSPALFASFRSSAAGAFDNQADFERFGQLSAAPDIGALPLHVSCGSDDAFAAQTRVFRAHVASVPAGGITRGCHTDGYWRSLAVEQLAFLGSHLG
ncbi:MAG: hypothetical protein QOG69_2048 [Actinomycetota bacterium]|nr:hypothetical protein [Actinomycetota bacterium]